MKFQSKHNLFLGTGRWGQKVSPTYSELLGRHLLIVGQTGSGKSTSAKQIVAQLQEQNITNIIFDPTGEYSQQVANNVTYKLGENAFIDLAKQSANQTMALLGLNWDAELSSKFEAAVTSLRIQQKKGAQGVLSKINLPIADYEAAQQKLYPSDRQFNLSLLAKQIVQEFVVPFADDLADYSLLGQEANRPTIRKYWPEIMALQEKLADTDLNHIFHFQEQNGSPLQYDLTFVLKQFDRTTSSHRSLVLDLSTLQAHPQIQAQVVSFLMDSILFNRLKSGKMAPIAIFIDETHRYLGPDERLKRHGIFHILREGRKSNLNLVLSSQSLLDMPAEMRGQFGQMLIHRYQNQADLAALVPSKILLRRLPKLPTGVALLTDGSKKRLIKIKNPNSK